MDDDDALYSKLFGEDAPLEKALPSKVSGDGSRLAPLLGTLPSETAYENGHSLKTWPSDDSKPPAKEPEVKASEEFQDFADAEKEFEDDEDDDFDVKLDQPEPQDDDELDLKLDDTDAAQAPLKENATENTVHKYVRPGATQTQTGSQPKPSPQPNEEGAAPRASRPVSANPIRPFSYPEYDPNDPGVLPSQAKGPGQRVRLPGQTKVTPDEYSEFLGLGHGDIFNLELDWVIDAPWRAPGADQSEFFNYGLTAKRWKEYTAKVKQYREDLTSQRTTVDFGKSYQPNWNQSNRGTNANQQSNHKPLGWNDRKENGSGQVAERLALPSQEPETDVMTGVSGEMGMSMLPMPGMDLPLPPFAPSDWARSEREDKHRSREHHSSREGESRSRDRHHSRRDRSRSRDRDGRSSRSKRSKWDAG